MVFNSSKKTKIFTNIATYFCFELVKNCDTIFIHRDKQTDKFVDCIIIIASSKLNFTTFIIVELCDYLDENNIKKDEIYIKIKNKFPEIEFPNVENIFHFLYLRKNENIHLKSDVNLEYSNKFPNIGFKKFKHYLVIDYIPNNCNIDPIIFPYVGFYCSYEQKKIENLLTIEITKNNEPKTIGELFLSYHLNDDFQSNTYQDINLKYFNSMRFDKMYTKDVGIFLIRNVNSDIFAEVVLNADYFTEELSGVTKQTKFLLSDNLTLKSVVEYLKKENITENVHEVNYEIEFAMFNWIRTSGNVTSLKEFLVKAEMEYRTEPIISSITIIHGLGTCGKTMFLNNLHKNLQEDDCSKLIIKLKQKDFYSFFKIPCFFDRDTKTILKEILNIQTIFEGIVFEQFLKIDGKITLLFDEIDNFQFEQLETFVCFIKQIQIKYPCVHIWITSRDVLCSLLEKSLSIFSHELPEYDEYEQEELLKKLLPKLDEQDIKNLAKKGRTENEHYQPYYDILYLFMMNPFHILLVADLYKFKGINQSFYCIDIYEYYVNRYYATNENDQKNLETDAFNFFCYIEFNSNNEYSLPPPVKHQIIIEYLVARYFVNNLEKIDYNLFEKKCMKNIFNLFNRLMFKDSLIAKAILNSDSVNFFKISSNVDVKTIKDKLNRNLLHIVKKSSKIGEYLIEMGVSLHQKDNNFWTPTRIADNSIDLELLNIYLKHGADNMELKNLREKDINFLLEIFYESLNKNYEYIILFILDIRKDFKFTEDFIFKLTESYQVSEDIKVKILECALEQKIQNNVIMENRKGSTPLHNLMSTHDLKVLRILIDKFKYNVNQADNFGNQIISEASNIEVIKFLIESGADPNYKNPLNGKTPFISACEKGDIELMKFYHQHYKVDFFEKCNDGLSALHYAVISSNLDAVIYLHKNSFNNLNIENNENNETPIFIACRYGNFDIVNYLIKNGATLNIKNSLNKFPINEIPLNNNTSEYFEFLRINEIEPLISQQFDVIFKLITENSKLFLENYSKENVNINWNIIDNDGNTFLHKYIKYFSDINILEFLIENCVNIDVRNTSDGCTPLHYAFLTNKLDFSRKLIECDANIYEITNKGENILYFVTQDFISFELLDLLIEYKFDINSFDGGNGKTLIHYLVYNFIYGSSSYYKIREFKDKYLINVNSKDKNGQTALHNVCADNPSHYLINEIIITCLKDWKIDASIIDIRNRTALHFAVENNLFDVIRLFEKYVYLDVDVTDNDGMTPIIISKVKNYVNIEHTLNVIKSKQDLRD